MTDDVKPEGPYSIGSPVWPGIAKLVEETGELNQVLGKIIATGGDTTYYGGDSLHDKLVQELGDVFAALRFFIDHNLSPEAQHVIENRFLIKMKKFELWHRKGIDRSA
jgi:NTP pyrophosphatase (non-canonical NTP hydrolase)